MRILALSCAVLPFVSGIVLLLATTASRRGARLFAGLGLGIAVVVAALVFRQGRIELYGSFGSDPLSSFLVELVLVALAIPLARPSGGAASGRLILGGTLAILAVSTRDLLWATLLLVLFPFVVRQEREESETETSSVWIWVFTVVCLVGLAVVASVGGGTDLSALASSGLSVSGVGRGGLAVVATGLVLLWLAHSREGFRFSGENLVWCVSSSFLLLVAVASVLLRLTAWIPEIALGSSGSPGPGSPGAPHEVLRALVLGALVLGALGMLGSTRIRTFMTALALARAGIVLAPLLGGVHGRVPLLLELCTMAAALFVLAWGIETASTGGKAVVFLDDLEGGASPATRLSLLVGALSACSFPPFPGFWAQFPLARALASEGETSLVVGLSVLVFLVGLGSMRIVSRVFSGGGDRASSRGPGAREAILGLGLAAVSMWFLGVFPARLIELATRAIAEMF